MQARMNHPAMVVPDAMKVLQSLGDVTKKGLPEKLLELVHLRASQINGCSVCVDMHPKIAKKVGETDERLFCVAAWRDAPYFTEGERAALTDGSADPAQRPRRSRAGCDLERSRQTFRRAGTRDADFGDRQHQRLEQAQRRRAPARGRMEDLARFSFSPCGKRRMRGLYPRRQTPHSPPLRADDPPSPTRGEGKAGPPKNDGVWRFLPNFTSRDGRQVSTPTGVLI